MKLRFPGFKILDRYILGKFLATYFFAIAMIIIVVVLFDYVEKIDDFTELHAPLRDVIFDYYLNFIPFFINQFSGLFTFIACIFFTSKMAYQTEIVAMLSGGMSFRRLMWPYFLGALIIGSLSLTLNLWLIPISQRHIVNFESQYIKRKQNNKFNRHIYRQIEPGTFAYIRGYNDGSQQASFLALEHYYSGTMTRSLEASDVKFNPETKRWTAPRYTKREFDSLGVEKFEQFRNLDTLYTKAYLHHLVTCGEMLAAQIASLHNIAFYLRLVTMAREHIAAGDFRPWKETMVQKLTQRL